MLVLLQAVLQYCANRKGTRFATRPAEVVALILAAPLGTDGMEGAEGASDADHTDWEHIHGFAGGRFFQKVCPRVDSDLGNCTYP